MLKALELMILIASLTDTAWLEWAILKHAGPLWALFFGGFFLLPWSAVVAGRRRRSQR